MAAGLVARHGAFGSKDALVLMSLWGVGNFMIIYLAALGDIPPQLYEAAELDGAGPLSRFRHITLPLLSPVIFFNLVMGLIHAVQAFTQIYIVSDGQGDPAGSALVLSLVPVPIGVQVPGHGLCLGHGLDAVRGGIGRDGGLVPLIAPLGVLPRGA